MPSGIWKFKGRKMKTAHEALMFIENKDRGP